MIYQYISLTKENVKAMLDGYKTVTRRIIKPQPPADCLYFPQDDSLLWGENEEDTLKVESCPYAMKLRVLEPYVIVASLKLGDVRGFYLADKSPFQAVLTESEYERFEQRKRPYAPMPGRYMYRSLSRITLRRELAVGQRLCEITDEDALAEGIPRDLGFPPRKLFMRLWDTINKDFPSQTNPLVWAMTFQWRLNDD